MSLGPLLFAQPFALLGLLALPIIWWLLRATPPEPQSAELPSLALMEDLDPREETPDKTPWWIIALRFAAAALAILGFARPSIMPEISAVATAGPVMIVIDDGWTSAPRWREISRTAISAADDAAEDGLGVQLLFTAPKEIPAEPSDLMQANDARRQIQSARPVPWMPDRSAALELIRQGDQRPARIIWVSDGMNHGQARDFMAGLKALAPLEIRPFAPRGAYAISEARFSPDGALVSVRRTRSDTELEATISAESREGAAIASADAVFAKDDLTTQVQFKLPSAALNRVARFRILGVEGAGAVWLWDDAAQAPTIALADPIDNPQPLLEEFYYVRKALADDARLIEGPLSEMLDARPDAIILGDRSDLTGELADKLSAWIEEGGALIRFAGPLLAANGDEFTPTPLRPAARALGGALAWDDPQTIAAFPAESPFNGLSPPEDALVRRQVLAQPQPDLDRYTWARLADGTPLVTAATRGRGAVILFHVTANTDWSDLPYSGVFPQLLTRSAISGAMGGSRRTDTGGSLAPIRILNGLGAMTQPPATAKPIPTEEFATALPSPTTMPGLYAGPQGSRSLNVGTLSPDIIGQWPAGVTVIEDAASAQRKGLDSWLIGGALLLLLIDAIVALAVSGRLAGLTSRAAMMVATVMFGGMLMTPPEALADDMTPKQREAALELRFAYVQTGDSRRDETAPAGLMGLSYQLYRRSSVEPADPHMVVLGEDELELYPMIYYSPPRGSAPLTDKQVQALNDYMRSGGALVIDTADATPGVAPAQRLQSILQGLNAPPLRPAPDDHVLTRSFYLIDAFPGRLGSQPLWIESTAVSTEAQRGDGVSRLFIGSVDWAGAWAVDDDYEPMFPMSGDENQREMAYRFGVNLVMYVLTGNYKEDQVHLPALLERLDEEAEMDESNASGNRVRTLIDDQDTPAPQEDRGP